MKTKNNKQRSYSKEFSIKLALDSSSPTQAAKDLGIPSSTLHGWIHQAKVVDFTQGLKSSDSQAKITMNRMQRRYSSTS